MDDGKGVQTIKDLFPFLEGRVAFESCASFLLTTVFLLPHWSGISPRVSALVLATEDPRPLDHCAGHVRTRMKSP